MSQLIVFFIISIPCWQLFTFHIRFVNKMCAINTYIFMYYQSDIFLPFYNFLSSRKIRLFKFSEKHLLIDDAIVRICNTEINFFLVNFFIGGWPGNCNSISFFSILCVLMIWCINCFTSFFFHASVCVCSTAALTSLMLL